MAAGTAVATVEAGGKPPAAVICIPDDDGPAAAGDAEGYMLVVNKRRDARRPRAAKAAAGRAPVGRLSVQKGGRAAAAGNRYTVVREAPRLRGVRGAGVGRAVLRGGGERCGSEEV